MRMTLNYTLKSHLTQSITTTELQIESCLSDINRLKNKNFLKDNIVYHNKTYLIIFQSSKSSFPKSNFNIKLGDGSICQ